MGMGQLWLIMGGAFMAYNGWGSYDKVSCFVWQKWKYAQKMLVFRGVPSPIIT